MRGALLLGAVLLFGLQPGPTLEPRFALRIKNAIPHQAEVAATVLGLLALDVNDFNPAAGIAIPATGANR
jgi:hypothetical protein